MAHQSASQILPKLFITATAAGGTILACHQLEGQRRILDKKSDGCTSSTIPAALLSLRTSGVAIVDNLCLTPNVVNEVKNMPAAKSMPTQLLKPKRQQRRRGPPGAHMMPPQDEPWRLSAYGRYHCLENHLGDEDILLLEQIEQQIFPLVQGFFQQDSEEEDSDEGGYESLKSATATNTLTTNTIDGIYRSELQLMTSVPGSSNQSWHKDNRSRGLSIIIPLVDFTADNGGTKLLIGSHNNSLPLGSGQGARVINAPAGSVVAYDSRTIHRGLGNETSEGRPALIFCYDRIESPPPGCGTLGSVGTSYQGRLVDILTGARNALSPK
mmetsp:Transcript_5198/g.6704  ORF Transcript_5198/g.6704 Transcript_5198/m.6704 type:complete len:326 (-) Transcript_5198:260-1237(-)